MSIWLDESRDLHIQHLHGRCQRHYDFRRYQPRHDSCALLSDVCRPDSQPFLPSSPNSQHTATTTASHATAPTTTPAAGTPHQVKPSPTLCPPKAATAAGRKARYPPPPSTKRAKSSATACRSGGRRRTKKSSPQPRAPPRL